MKSNSAEHSWIQQHEKIQSHVKQNHQTQSSSLLLDHQEEETIIRKKEIFQEKNKEASSSGVSEKIKFDRNKLHHLLLKRKEIIEDVEQVRKSTWDRRNSTGNNSCNRKLLMDHEERIHPYFYRNHKSRANTQTLDALAELAKKQRWRQHKQSTSPSGVLEFHLQSNRSLNNDVISHAEENTSQGHPPQYVQTSNTSLGMISVDSSIHEQDETLSIDDINTTMMTANDTNEYASNYSHVCNEYSNSYNSPCAVTRIGDTKENLPPSPLTSSSHTNHDRHVDYLEQLCTLFIPLSSKSSKQDESLLEQDDMDDSFQNLTLLKTWDDDSFDQDGRSYISALTDEGNCKRLSHDGNTIVKKILILFVTLICCISCDMNECFTSCTKLCTSVAHDAMSPLKTVHGVILTFHVNVIDIFIDTRQRVRNILDLEQLPCAMHEYIIKSYQETKGYHSGIDYNFIHKFSSAILEEEMISSNNMVSDASQLYFQREVIYSCDPMSYPMTNSMEFSFQREMYTCDDNSSSLNDVSYQVTPRLLCLRRADFGFQKYKVLYQKDSVSVFVEDLKYKNEMRIMKKWKMQVPNIKLNVKRRSLFYDVNLQWSDFTNVANYQGEANAFLFRRRVPSFFSFNRLATTTSWLSNSSAIDSSTEILARNNSNRCRMGYSGGDLSLPLTSHLNYHKCTPTQAKQEPSVKEYLNSNEDDISFDLNIGETIMELIKLAKPRIRKFGSSKKAQKNIMY